MSAEGLASDRTLSIKEDRINARSNRLDLERKRRHHQRVSATRKGNYFYTMIARPGKEGRNGKRKPGRGRGKKREERSIKLAISMPGLDWEGVLTRIHPKNTHEKEGGDRHRLKARQQTFQG